MRESENNAIFELQKVKITPDGGLCVNYKLYEQSNCNKFKIQSTNAPHPDMLDLFDKLQPIVAQVFEMADCTPIAVCGLTIGGKGESEGAIVSAIFTTAAGQQTTIATPRLKYHTNAYGFEEELNAIVAGIEDEVYKYLFEDKTAVLDTFNAD